MMTPISLLDSLLLSAEATNHQWRVITVSWKQSAVKVDSTAKSDKSHDVYIEKMIKYTILI
jgi:hypothetical protein